MSNKQWEYCRRGESFVLDERQMNNLGREGWELVSVTDDLREINAYFKRQVLSKKETTERTT